jgi:hypothetical protein
MRRRILAMRSVSCAPGEECRCVAAFKSRMKAAEFTARDSSPLNVRRNLHVNEKSKV